MLVDSPATNLHQLLEEEDPSLVFLSEPWLHLSDAPIAMELFLHNYLFYLNSEDRHDPFLSLTHSRAHGGTLAMWRRELDPYITILEPVSSRILVLILDKPGFQISAHIAIYLTTSGHDAQYMQDLALLQDTIDTITDKYPDCITYIRGDANASVLPRANNKRDDLFYRNEQPDTNQSHHLPSLCQ